MLEPNGDTFNYKQGNFSKTADLVATVAVDPSTGTAQTGLPPGRASAAGSVPVAIDAESFVRLTAMAYGGSGSSVVNVPSAAANTLIKAANASRVGLTIANDSTSIMYVLQGTGVPSATNYSFALPAKGTVAADRTISGYSGEVRATWATANGFAMVTEVS